MRVDVLVVLSHVRTGHIVGAPTQAGTGKGATDPEPRECGPVAAVNVIGEVAIRHYKGREAFACGVP